MRILVVEDNDDSRKLLVKQLQAFGHEVTSAINGKEALVKALENPPEITVTDILMPEMDGYQLCMEWKTNDLLKKIPLIFYSATYTSDMDEKFSNSLGVDAFIRKPTDFDNFLKILSEVVEKAKTGETRSPEFSASNYSRFLFEHNKRLLAKLYKKVDQLETDISERQKAEQALKESEEKFRQFFENAQVYCYMVSPQGIILNANNCVCQGLGYDKQELIGQPLSKLYAPESLPMYRQISGQWRQTGLVESEELVVLTKGGQRRNVLLSTGAIRDKNDLIIGSVSVQKDITELKQSQAKALQVESLTQLNKAKSEILSNVAHELRTPLQSIKGFIETLIEPDVKWSEKQQLEFLEEANKEVEVLNRLIRDLLDISRIESGKIKLDKQTYRLEEILESAKARLTILMANHKLEIKIPAGLQAIVADKMRISQVITNLVENATKFSPKGSVITISAKIRVRDFVLSVSDQGVGMAQATMDKLFSRFYQGEQTNGEAKIGTGLGLSICRGIVEAHNGKIWVESSPGNGSVFSFSLPITEKPG